jgi:hypothetical protein
MALNVQASVLTTALQCSEATHFSRLPPHTLFHSFEIFFNLDVDTIFSSHLNGEVLEMLRIFRCYQCNRAQVNAYTGLHTLTH